MQITRNTLLIALLCTFAFASCKKYEEGPVVSLRSKKERVANTWVMEKIIDSDGTEYQGSQIPDNEITYTKDGDVENEDGDKIGEWEFGDSKESLIFKPEVGDESENDILRLKEDELWLEDENGNENHFEPA